MGQQIIELLKDLLDDHNVTLYMLFVLALVTPELRELIAGGILGYWTKSIKSV